MFFWCYVRHTNPVKIQLERITQKDKEFVHDFNYNGIKFPVSKADFSKIETKNNICFNGFCYENKLTFPINISDQKFEYSTDLLLTLDKDKSHYAYIKIFYRFMFIKSKNKNKKYFCKSCLQCFCGKNAFPTNLIVLMIELVNQLLFTEVKILLINLLKKFLNSLITAKK